MSSYTSPLWRLSFCHPSPLLCHLTGFSAHRVLYALSTLCTPPSPPPCVYNGALSSYSLHPLYGIPSHFSSALLCCVSPACLVFSPPVTLRRSRASQPSWASGDKPSGPPDTAGGEQSYRRAWIPGLTARTGGLNAGSVAAV